MERVSPEEFEALVSEALDSVPAEFQEYLGNTLVSVEEEPSPKMLSDLGVPRGSTLFGLYTGTPLTKRESNFAALPDAIALFRGPILRACRTREQVVDQIRKTVVHEIGHFFGLSDQDLP
ncbi:MAG: metallopeptidase family protein [Thermoanaerobaculia bacterium]